MVTIDISGHRISDGKPASGQLVLTDNDVEKLRKYDEICERLSRAAIFASGFPTLQTIGMTASQGLTVTVSDFKDSEVSEFLHLARPLMLDKETTSFKKVLAIYRRGLGESELGIHVKYLSNLYLKGDYSKYLRLSAAGMAVFSDEMTRIWLNGGEYHHDEEKILAVQRVEAAISPEAARGLFVAQLSGRVKAIDRLHTMVVNTLEVIRRKTDLSEPLA